MWPFTKKENEFLKPGECECGHNRCSHKNGKGRCKGIRQYETYWANCSCQIYIPKKDDGGDDDTVPAPTPAELEKMFQI